MCAHVWERPSQSHMFFTVHQCWHPAKQLSSTHLHMLLPSCHVWVCLNFMNSLFGFINCKCKQVLFCVFCLSFFSLVTVNQSVKSCQTWFVACCVHAVSQGRKIDPCEQYVKHLIASPSHFAIPTETNVNSLWKGASHKCVLMTFWNQKSVLLFKL